MGWYDDWKDDAEVCGNCKHWALGGYQHDWPGSTPLGNAGNQCDGREGDCRRRAPIGIQDHSPSRNAVWPRTSTMDTCGEFEKRPQTFRRLREEYRPTDITGAALRPSET